MKNDGLGHYLIIAGFLILLVAVLAIFTGYQFSVFSLQTGPVKATVTGVTPGQATILIIGFGFIIIGNYIRING